MRDGAEPHRCADPGRGGGRDRRLLSAALEWTRRPRGVELAAEIRGLERNVAIVIMGGPRHQARRRGNSRRRLRLPGEALHNHDSSSQSRTRSIAERSSRSRRRSGAELQATIDRRTLDLDLSREQTIHREKNDPRLARAASSRNPRGTTSRDGGLLPDDRLRSACLRSAARSSAPAEPLHDIGKVGIPDGFSSSVGPLNHEERPDPGAHRVGTGS